MRHIDETVPCYKCEKRHSGCHSSCPEYAEFHKKRTDHLEAMQKIKNDEKIFDSVHIRGVEKVKKRKKGAKYWKRY